MNLTSAEYRDTVARARQSKKRRADHEGGVHRSILRYLREVLPDTYRVIHIPNAPRSKITGAKLKAMGMMAGAPDLMILRPCARVAWIEVKPERGGKLTKDQRDFRDWCKAEGHPWALCRSVDDARDFIEAEKMPTKESKNGLV